MLAHENRGRRCDDHLITGQSGKRGRPKRYLRLAIADIAHHQPIHRLAAQEILPHGGDRARLIGRFVERKAAGKAFIGCRVGLHHRSNPFLPGSGEGRQRPRALRNRLVDLVAALRPG